MLPPGVIYELEIHQIVLAGQGFLDPTRGAYSAPDPQLVFRGPLRGGEEGRWNGMEVGKGNGWEHSPTSFFHNLITAHMPSACIQL